MTLSRENHTIFLAAWTGAWLVTLALAVFGPEFLWNSTEGPTWLAVFLNLVAGVGMIVTNVRYLASIDEMMQRIHLEALAISLGIGVVGGLGYSVLDVTNLIPFDAEIGHVVGLFGLTYIVAVCVGLRRRR